MTKTVTIDGREIKLKSTALTVYKYREVFGSDLVVDMQKLQESINNKDELGTMDLTVFMKVAYIFAKSADPTIEETCEEWLDTFETFSIYEVMPEIMDIWKLSNKTTAIPKKK